LIILNESRMKTVDVKTTSIIDFKTTNDLLFFQRN
jgi:hypothetical protein